MSEYLGLVIERWERILHDSLECGHDLVEEQPCAQCRLEARIAKQRQDISDMTAESLEDQKLIVEQQARIEALEAERRWMPFEKPEQLPQTMWAPNYSDPILVAILSGKTRFVRDDRYDFVQDRWDSGCVGVTHWMPLPEPPEAEK